MWKTNRPIEAKPTKDKPTIGLLIVDLDNTLWDWVDVWVNSFSALLSTLAEDSGVPLETLKSEMKSVHQRRGTTEYSLLLEELPSLKPLLKKGETARSRFNRAEHAQNSVRKHETRLFPTVLSTLTHIKTKGVKVVAYTESLQFWTEWRIRKTGLDGVLDVLYTSPDHDLPAGVTREQIRTLSKDSYGLKYTQHREVERGIVKPDPQILQEIVAEHAVGTLGVAYVGDNISKDIIMAQSVGVFDVHAAYGEAHTRPEYALLREVTHWTDEMVEKERDSRPGMLPAPSFVLKERFAEILDLFEFGPALDVDTHVKLWEKSVDVQQHFNDLGWRIRALALTALTFTLGATGFAYVNTSAIPQLGGASLAPFIPILGVILWAAFWFMDSLWFHRLLKGAVDEGTRLERLLRQVNIRVDLGGNIGRASPVGKMRSTNKLNVFYGSIALVLAGISVILFFVGAPTKDDDATTTNNVFVVPLRP